MQQDLDTTTNATDLGRGLETLLARQLTQIRRRFLLHGIGWITAAFAMLIGAYYFLDRTLALPAPIRILLTVACAGLLITGLRRKVLYPLSRAFGRNDVALALERRFPDLRQRLISAVQLKDDLAGNDKLRNQSAMMIEQLIAETARETKLLDFRELLNTGRTLRLWGVSATLFLILSCTFAANPVAMGIFFERVFGFSTDYPHLTILHVELPEQSDEYQIESSGDRQVRIRIAAGADLPILVRAEGVVPREVHLAISGGRGMPPEIAMTARGAGRFRYVFRRVHDDFRFYAKGGDDDRGDLDIEIVTITPPRVSTIRTLVTYPAYTRKDPAEASGGNIQALVNSRVALIVTATAEVSKATITFLDSATTVELSPFELDDDSGSTRAYRGEFVITESDRYQVQLVSPDGLGNPHPGTYPVTALKDHAPVGRILIPSNDDINVLLAQAIIPLRFEAGDDFGLTSIRVTSTTGRDAFQKVHNLLNPAVPNPAVSIPAVSGPLGPATARATNTVFTTLLEVGLLGPADGSVKTGDGIQLTIELRDNREPEALTTNLAETRLHVVSQADLARRIAGHYRRIRENVEKAISMQEDRLGRTAEIREGIAAGDTIRKVRPSLLAIEVGQGRILATARRIHREFMRSFNVHLFNRLETSINAPKVLELYVRFHRENSERAALIPAFYRSLSEAQQTNRLGAMENTLDPILRMIERGDRIAVQLAPDAVRTVETAGAASDRTTLQGLLPKVEELQKAILVELLGLRERLDEWNEFQDVIFNARAIRDRQKDVKIRTSGTTGSGSKTEGRKR